MLTALIAAVAGVAGLVIGRWWDTRSESDRWRRDRRIRSCEEVAAEFCRLREAVRLLAMLDLATPDFDAQRSRVEEAYAQWTVWPQLREPLYASFDDYVDAVRRELSLPRLTVLRAGAAARQTPAAGRNWSSSGADSTTPGSE